LTARQAESDAHPRRLETGLPHESFACFKRTRIVGILKVTLADSSVFDEGEGPRRPGNSKWFAAADYLR
jgi:hypothetical protein